MKPSFILRSPNNLNELAGKFKSVDGNVKKKRKSNNEKSLMFSMNSNGMSWRWTGCTTSQYCIVIVMRVWIPKENVISGQHNCCQWNTHQICTHCQYPNDFRRFIGLVGLNGFDRILVASLIRWVRHVFARSRTKTATLWMLWMKIHWNSF